MDYKPITTFQNAIKFWWLIILGSMIGVLGGLIFSYTHPQKYRAVANFYATIDTDNLNELNLPVDQYQYNEDLALSSTMFILHTDTVLSKVVQSLSQQGIQINEKNLQDQHRLDRKHAIWSLQFFHTDPDIALFVVNTWAQIGYENMLENQKSGLISGYVDFAPPSFAVSVDGPTVYNRNYLMIVGFLLGFLVVILGLEVRSLLKK